MVNKFEKLWKSKNYNVAPVGYAKFVYKWKHIVYEYLFFFVRTLFLDYSYVSFFYLHIYFKPSV